MSGSIITQVIVRARGSLRDLVVTDIFFKLVAFVVLTPMLGVCQRLTVWLAGDGLLSDVDFALLFTRPVGFACAVLVAAVWLAIMGMEQASLLAILAAKDEGKRLRPIAAIRFALFKVVKVLSITATLVAASLLVLLPIIVVVLLVYRGLLGEYDINFYLSEKPSEFLVALGIAGVLVAIGVAALVFIHSAWILSLPIALFEKQTAWAALATSRQRIGGHRWRVIRWVAVWLAMVLLANALVGALGVGIGRLLLPTSAGSLAVLATRVGLLLLFLAALGLLINLFATITFASVLDTGYRLFQHDGPSVWSELVASEESQDSRFALTRWRLAALLAIGLVLTAWIGFRALQAVPLQDNAEVMAHRGASAEAPENTMAAFELAIEQGADWIEIDVQESADGQVIVMHDSDFMKQSGNPLKVWDATGEQLEQIDIGSWFDPRFADQRVATLAEVLELCRDKIGVNIELKYYGHQEQLEQRVVDIVEAAGMADQVKVMSLKKEGVAKVRKLRPDWENGLLLSVYAGDLEKYDVDFFAINANFASRGFIRRAHAAGKEVYVWTVNDAATMSQMLNRGVDGLLTDRPALARQVLTERAEMTLAERLLSGLSVWLLGK